MPATSCLCPSACRSTASDASGPQTRANVLSPKMGEYPPPVGRCETAGIRRCQLAAGVRAGQSGRLVIGPSPQNGGHVVLTSYHRHNRARCQRTPCHDMPKRTAASQPSAPRSTSPMSSSAASLAHQSAGNSQRLRKPTRGRRLINSQHGFRAQARGRCPATASCSVRPAEPDGGPEASGVQAQRSC